VHISLISDAVYEVEGIQISNLHNRTYCIFDLEGTGIFPESEYITQFGAVLYENGKIAGTFRSPVKSPKRIPDTVEALTGVTNEIMAGAATFPEAYKQFLDFCGDAVLVAQAGYEYDLPMIRRHCRDHGLTFFTNPVIDTKALFAHIHRELYDVFSSDYLIRYYHIDDSDIKRHDALEDCVLISRFLHSILAEYSARGLNDFELTEKLQVKRFVIPEMFRDMERGPGGVLEWLN